MKGTMIIFLVAVFLLLIAAYLSQDEAQGRLGSKAYHMLLLGLLRLDAAVARGLRYVDIALEHVFKGYHISHVNGETIRRKEQRIAEYRISNGMEYKRKRYNRKILD